MRVKLGEVVRIDTSVGTPAGDKVWLLNLDMIEQQTGRIIDRLMVSPNEIGGSTVGFDKECVLYSKLRPNLNKVVLPDMDGVATSEILPLRCAKDVRREYLCWYLRSPAFLAYAESRTAGAKMPRLGFKELLAAEITLPSVDAQDQIVRKLEEISNLILVRESQIAKFDQLIKSRFVEAA